MNPIDSLEEQIDSLDAQPNVRKCPILANRLN